MKPEIFSAFEAKGFVKDANGSYAKRKKTLDASSDAGPTPKIPGVSVVAEPARVVISQSTDEAKLNKTERAFLANLRFIYAEVGIQDITIKLGDDCRYTPDLNVWEGALKRVLFYEVKGFMRDDALVKLKVAARKCHKWAIFFLVKKSKSGWEINEVKP